MNIKQKIASSISIPISLMTLFSVFMNVVHAEKAAALMSSGVNAATLHKVSKQISKSPTKIHIEMLSFASDTYNVRTQPPSPRPREDDDTEDNAKRRLIEGFGNFYSTNSI